VSEPGADTDSAGLASHPIAREPWAVGRSTFRLAVWVVIVVAIILMLSVMLPPTREPAGQGVWAFPIATVSTLAISVLSLLGICLITEVSPLQGSWIAVNVIVIAVAMIASSEAPQWSGVIAGAVFAPFVLAPSILTLRALRHARAGRLRIAARYWRVASWLHPSQLQRYNAAFIAASAIGPLDARLAAYAALARKARPVQVIDLDCSIAMMRGDWAIALERNEAGTKATWIEVRALGELGRVDDMISAYASARFRQPDHDQRLCVLFVLAFTGRVDQVSTLLRGDLRILAAERKAYWSVVAANAAGAVDEEARRTLTDHAAASDNEGFRLDAQRLLMAAPVPGGVVLSPESAAKIAELEQALLNPEPRGAPLTLILLIAMIAGFLIEQVYRGSNDSSALVALGALSAARVLHGGEWWRLATSPFLQDGVFRLLVDLYLLLLLGVMCETRSGRWTFAASCVTGSLGASIAALWVMAAGSSSGPIYVGATGIVFALAGSNFARWLGTRRAPRAPSDNPETRVAAVRRYLQPYFFVLLLALDFAVDSYGLRIGYAPYVAGFVAGFVVNVAAQAMPRWAASTS
jgi:membrane associated rhomboid family serine protease